MYVHVACVQNVFKLELNISGVQCMSVSLQVGGDFFEAALTNMNSSGRVCVIGSISEYNLTETPSSIPLPAIMSLFCICINQTQLNTSKIILFF